jgi:hypothetical protein
MAEERRGRLNLLDSRSPDLVKLCKLLKRIMKGDDKTMDNDFNPLNDSLIGLFATEGRSRPAFAPYVKARPGETLKETFDRQRGNMNRDLVPITCITGTVGLITGGLICLASGPASVAGIAAYAFAGAAAGAAPITVANAGMILARGATVAAEKIKTVLGFKSAETPKPQA